jgi:NADH-ubiquinone oxidoreductase chain 4
VLAIFLIANTISYETKNAQINYCKKVALIASIINLIISLIVYIMFDFNANQFQFVQDHYNISFFDVYLGIDGISIYFVILTTVIMPIALLSN